MDNLSMDYHHLTRELDRTKSRAFSGKNAAFLGSILCSMDFQWTHAIPTAATNGEILFWNPDWFQKIPIEARQTVLIHELWHCGRLHFTRLGNRDPRIWNYATDIRINNDLKAEGYSFNGIEDCWIDPRYPPGMAEEDIYDDLIKRAIKIPPTPAWPGGLPQPGGSEPAIAGEGDMFPSDPTDKEAVARTINNVVRAVQQANIADEAGNLPGDIQLILTRFLTPVVPWEQILHEFMRELVVEAHSWNRPNRRYPGIYLPSRFNDEGRLSHLNYYEDVSGSITEEDLVRFNSEVKYVKETYRPEKMTLVQFDTQITQEINIEQDDPFERVKVIGRGGTSLVPVREHIIKHKPTAAIIFSDMECTPMEPLPQEFPIIWVCIRNRKISVPFGKVIHIH